MNLGKFKTMTILVCQLVALFFIANCGTKENAETLLPGFVGADALTKRISGADAQKIMTEGPSDRSLNTDQYEIGYYGPEED